MTGSLAQTSGITKTTLSKVGGALALLSLSLIGITGCSSSVPQSEPAAAPKEEQQSQAQSAVPENNAKPQESTSQSEEKPQSTSESNAADDADASTVCGDLEVLKAGKCVKFDPDCAAAVSYEGDPDLLTCGDALANIVDLNIEEVHWGDSTYHWAWAITPSQNMGCEYDPESGKKLGCWIMDRDWAKPMHAKQSEGPGCSGFTIDSQGVVDPYCRGDAPGWWFAVNSESFDRSQIPVMEYGSAYRFPDGNVCQSAESGLTCWSPETLHGFFLSRAEFFNW